MKAIFQAYITGFPVKFEPFVTEALLLSDRQCELRWETDRDTNLAAIDRFTLLPNVGKVGHRVRIMAGSFSHLPSKQTEFQATQ